MLETRKRGLKLKGSTNGSNVMVSLFGHVAKNKKCLNHIKSCIFTYDAKPKNQAQLINHKNNPFITHDSYFPIIMTVPISESNPKIQCQYVLLKAAFFF